MNLKKFISGVSAFAIAASAFAAMAVTASATDYNESLTVVQDNTHKVASYGKVGSYQGVATASTLASGEYSAVWFNFSELEDIENATSVTVEFDTYMQSGKKVVYGFGDASQRTGIANSSGVYKLAGLAAYFGSTDGSAYKITDVKSSQSLTCAANYFGNVVHASITFDKEASQYSFTIGGKTATMDTDITNLTYIDAYTNTSGASYMINNVTVSYTVPDAPAVPVVSTSVENAAAFTVDDGYDENMVVGVISLNVSGAAIDLADATYQGQTGTVDGDTSFIGEALINVVITGATSVDALNDIVFN